MTLQFGVLVGMMVTNWFSKSLPEIPYDFTAPMVYPERQCCCPGGVKAEKLDMGSCANKEPGAALVVDDTTENAD